jgi:hypothetical protein
LNRRIAELTIADLTTFWRAVDITNPEVARDELLRFLPSLVAKYGDLAATVSSDWYADVRAASGVPVVYRPTLAARTPDAKVLGTTRRLAGDLFTDHPETMLESLAGWMSKYALQGGRDTIELNARRDPWKPRVARVPTGATTCSFCLMLASRGAVYSSRSSAGELTKFHPHDDCQIVVIGKNQPLPDGYDPAELYDQYREAQAAEASLAHSH